MTYSMPSVAAKSLLLLLLTLSTQILQGQVSLPKANDTAIRAKFDKLKDTAPDIFKERTATAKEKLQFLADTVKQLPDSLIEGSLRWLEERKKITKEKISSAANNIITTPAGLKMKRRDFLNDLSLHTYSNLFDSKKLLRFGGGYVSYQFDYRSNIDTPYIEKDLAQHNTTGHLNFTLADIVPLRVTFWSRQSNSSLFRDITSVNISFDAGAFRNQLQSAMRNRLLSLAPQLKDSLTEKWHEIKKLQLTELSDLIKTRFSPQALVEANQVLKVPGITWKQDLPDSVNIVNEAAARKAAAAFLEMYRQTIETIRVVQSQTDSLKLLYDRNMARIADFNKLVNGKWDQLINTPAWRDKLAAYGLEDAAIPRQYKWLMGLRNLSLGRSTINTSELTAKNISVNGINLEYNSWYYIGLTAGLVDYRFRDFAVNGFNRKPQFLYMGRVGIGRLEKNYFIVGIYHGKKQLFLNSGLDAIPVTGLSAEAKWQLLPTTYLVGEFAKSISRDLRSAPRRQKTSLSLSDESNQAFSVKVQSYIPVTQSNVEAFYKKTGANFQSFSSFQANAAMESWAIKAEQPFFKRRLRISGSLRKNEFTNPYLEQNYSSNTVFKSLTASLRMNRWPIITFGYQPISQLTVFDDKIMENRFQTLTATVFHNYRLGKLQTSSTVMINKFYNNQKDSGFIYFNSSNIYITQQFMFSRFTASVGASYSKNGTYQLTVLEEGFNLQLDNRTTVGLGVKINNLNKETVKAGGFLNTSIKVFREDIIYLSYERGYLPAFNQGLVRNEMASVQFVKTF